MDISINIILITAGRNSIERAHIEDSKKWLSYIYNSHIYKIDLESFTSEETNQYLLNKGISDPSQMETIWQASRGLPLYLGLLTSNTQGTIDPTTGVVDNFLLWIPESEKIKRQLALDIALLTKPFNQDDLSIFPYIPDSKDEKEALYRWLTKLPFVRIGIDEWKYSYHEIVQDMFTKHIYQSSTDEYYSTRTLIANYYEEKLGKLLTDREDEKFSKLENREFIFALIHQLLLLPDQNSYIKAINYILQINNYDPYRQEVIKLLKQLQERNNNVPIAEESKEVIDLCISYLSCKKDNKSKLKFINEIMAKIENKSQTKHQVLSQLYIERASIYNNIKDYQAALVNFNKAIELDISNDKRYNSRGIFYLERKGYQAALADFTKAIELNPNNPNWYNNRGLFYKERKDYQAALADFGKAIELDPDTPSWYNNRGLLYKERKDYQVALADFTKAIELNPNNPRWYANRGLFYKECKDYQAALTDSNKAIELDPNNPRWYANRGLFYKERKDYQAALADFGKAIELNPNNPRWYANRGILYQEYKNYQAALADFGKAIELDPDDPRWYSNRGDLYQERKDYQAALADFGKAIELDPDDPRWYNNRGAFYQERKDYQAALADFDKAIQLDPDTPNWYANRGLLYKERKDYQAALVDFDKAIELPRDAQRDLSKQGAMVHE